MRRARILTRAIARLLLLELEIDQQMRISVSQSSFQILSSFCADDNDYAKRRAKKNVSVEKFDSFTYRECGVFLALAR